MSKKLTLDSSWGEHAVVTDYLDSLSGLNLSPSQKKLLTPIFINSTTLEILKDAYTKMFKKSGVLYTPSAWRYSFSFRVKGKNITVCSQYHLERDFNLMISKYGIMVHHETLKLTGASWEEEAYKLLKYFKGSHTMAQHKLLKTRVSDGDFIGWYFKEIFPDRAVNG